MQIVGIICEYNPFHNGHQRQMQMVRENVGDDCAIVCLMSGNYVQRGAPAIFDKSLRAKAAILAGADLVLELPIGVALSSAEGFAAGGVRILSQFCDTLSFGVETFRKEQLLETADALQSDEFVVYLKEALLTGCSFPAARQTALRKMGLLTSLQNPNDILAVEYTKAITAQKSALKILPVLRQGAYHAQELDEIYPSATAVRSAILKDEQWMDAVPACAVPVFENASVHSLGAGERAIVAKLRTMTDEEYSRLPFGSEGLWRKLMKASGSQATLDAIIESTKSKRYTRTRIDRMILCAFLGMNEMDMGIVPEKVRVLAFNDIGRTILKKHDCFVNAGEEISALEKRCEDLYGLFSVSGIDAPDTEKKRRVYYQRGNV